MTRGLAIAIGLMMAMAIAAVRPVAAQPAPSPAQAPADPQEAAFREASRKLLAGDLAGARAGYEAVVAAAPTGPWAEQGLLEAGQVAERQGDLAGARALYRRVLAEHPQARASRLAEARLTAIGAATGPDGRWDEAAAELDRITRAEAAGDPTARPAMAALLERSAGFPRWVPAAIWLGDASLRAGDLLGAAVWYRRARIVAATPDERFRAGMGEAGLWRRFGQQRLARALYRSLEPPDAIGAGARDQAVAGIDRSLRQRWWAWVARGVLAVAALLVIVSLRRRAGSWTGAARAWWPPPIEVVYLVPVAAALTFIAETGSPLAARAAELILAGAIVIAWASGAVLRTAGDRPGPGGRVAHLVTIAAATVSIIYLVVIREGLIDLLVETWRNGHDGR
ncbi:MAG TPA: tetratricopeptide repeat protein [Kofleriaceae bacterium]|nr:tetratricopeptide repeat protein [Kofleriaceae bacterium]